MTVFAGEGFINSSKFFLLFANMVLQAGALVCLNLHGCNLLIFKYKPNIKYY